MALPPYTTTLERVWFYTFRTICGLIFFFLIAPLVVIVPLSFNAVPYFTFTRRCSRSIRPGTRFAGTRTSSPTSTGRGR